MGTESFWINVAAWGAGGGGTIVLALLGRWALLVLRSGERVTVREDKGKVLVHDQYESLINRLQESNKYLYEENSKLHEDVQAIAIKHEEDIARVSQQHEQATRAVVERCDEDKKVLQQSINALQSAVAQLELRSAERGVQIALLEKRMRDAGVE